MKNVLFLLCFSFAAISSFAQQRTVFDYDYAANRIERLVITMRSSLQSFDADSLSKELEEKSISRKLLDCDVTAILILHRAK